MAACKMATLDGPVWERGDPSFSLTFSLSNPHAWMDLVRAKDLDPTLVVDRRGGCALKGINWWWLLNLTGTY
jgi:hypothetical protein